MGVGNGEPPFSLKEPRNKKEGERERGEWGKEKEGRRPTSLRAKVIDLKFVLVALV